MAIQYYPPISDPSLVYAEQLKFRYYIKLTPDGHHLVPGMLQQGYRPLHNGWLQIGQFDRNFRKRYFVQTTPYHTLVPGSLIVANKRPGYRWKEVKKWEPSNFHRFVFTEGNYTINLDNTGPGTLFSLSTEFIPNKAIPILQTLFPERDLINNPVYFQLFYIKGDFAAIEENPTNLSLFSDPASHLLYVLYTGGSHLETITNTGEYWDGTYAVTPFATNGIYSIALGVLNNEQEITDYVVLDSILRVQLI